MNPSSSQSVAAEVWRRFAGMFGREAVARKYGDAIPEEWPAMLSRLNEFQIQRGVRQLAYSGKAHVPSLPEFVKLCRDAEHDHIAGVLPAPREPEVEFDKWLIAANRNLLGYITTKIPENPRRYGEPPTYEAMKCPLRAHLANADASPEFIANVHTLVAFKNRWAELMHDCDMGDGVPPEEQKQAWNECMRMAEEQIAQRVGA